MTDIRRVLVTGHNGYIGSVLVRCLLRAGYDVVGLDTGYYSQCTLVDDGTNVSWIRKDIRDLTTADLHGIDAVVHLAALSNDPIGNYNGNGQKTSTTKPRCDWLNLPRPRE